MKRRKAGTNCSSKVSSNKNSKIDTPSTATAITTNCLDTKEILMSPKSSNSITGDISETMKTPTKADFDISSSIINDLFSVPLPVSASAPRPSSSTNKIQNINSRKIIMLDKYSKEIKNLRAERNNLYKHIEKLESRYLSYKELAKIIKSVSIILASVLINLIYYLTTLKRDYQKQVPAQCHTKTNY